jgi:hypothetical protein
MVEKLSSAFPFIDTHRLEAVLIGSSYLTRCGSLRTDRIVSNSRKPDQKQVTEVNRDNVPY